VLLTELRAADLLDFSRAAVDGSHVRAMKGGAKTGPSPVDRGRTGSKHHVIVEAHGIQAGGGLDIAFAKRPVSLVAAVLRVYGSPTGGRPRPRR
jgi:hypothetical protein